MMEQRQQELLDQFFQQEKVWCSDFVVSRMVAGLCIGITMLLLIMPVQIWEGEFQVMFFMFLPELIGIQMFLNPYCKITEDGKMTDLYEKFRMLPICRRQYAYYVFKKLFRCCLWMTGIAAACQTAFALMSLHTFSIGNLLIPVLYSMVLPMLLFCQQFRNCRKITDTS